MRKQLVRHAFLVSAVLAAFLVAQPALAYTEQGTTGTVGAHSLTDTSGSPGAICVYTYWSSESLWRLKHMYVNPPNMKAVPGQGNEHVAWRFIVQRQIWSAFSSHPGPWSNRYASPKFDAYTDSSHNASFSQGDVKVIVPFEPGADAVAAYRVLVKLFWYTSSDSVLGTATERVDWYNAYEELDTLVRHHKCGDYEV